MMKWILSLCLICSLAAEEEEEPTGISKNKPGYATRDATVLSMMGWGISIAVAIATFAALINNHTATSSSSSSTTPSS